MRDFGTLTSSTASDPVAVKLPAWVHVEGTFASGHVNIQANLGGSFRDLEVSGTVDRTGAFDVTVGEAGFEAELRIAPDSVTEIFYWIEDSA